MCTVETSWRVAGADMAKLRVQAEVDERDISLVKIGQRVVAVFVR